MTGLKMRPNMRLSIIAIPIVSIVTEGARTKLAIFLSVYKRESERRSMH